MERQAKWKYQGFPEKKQVCYFQGEQQNAVSHIHRIRCFQLNWSGKTMLINQEVNEKVNESKLCEVRATVRAQGIPKHHG